MKVRSLDAILLGAKPLAMPELPETETIASDLNSDVRGATFTATTVYKDDVLREATAELLARTVKGLSIAKVWRRAKCVVIDLSMGCKGEPLFHIVVQPRFTGGLYIADSKTPAEELRYSAVKFLLDDGRSLHYRDVRRLGTVSLMSTGRFTEYAAKLGVEPLSPELTGERFSSIVHASDRAIKVVLMDQRRLAGVGNIYANESLWWAGIDPSRPSSSLSDEESLRLLSELRRILHASILARGTSFRDYRDARGERGEFVKQLQAYGREGKPCSRCGKVLIGTHAIDGRSTVLCAWCQQ